MVQSEFVVKALNEQPDFFEKFCEFCEENEMERPLHPQYYPPTTYLFFSGEDAGLKKVLSAAVLYLIENTPIATLGFCGISKSIRRHDRKVLTERMKQKWESASRENGKILMMALPAHYTWKNSLRSMGYVSDSSLIGGKPIVSDLHLKKLSE